jgi:Rrf2 family protein
LKIGTRTRYGLRTMLEIALSESTKGVFQKEIAINQSLSNKYLDHIIHSLKTAGLICNVKGKKSGYLLTRKPDDISIFEIHKAFEPDLCLVECLSGNYNCDRGEKCQARGFWKEFNLVIVNYLKSVTLADLMHKQISTNNIEKIARQKNMIQNQPAS